jgi:hypothetical protein
MEGPQHSVVTPKSLIPITIGEYSPRFSLKEDSKTIINTREMMRRKGILSKEATFSEDPVREAHKDSQISTTRTAIVSGQPKP